MANKKIGQERTIATVAGGAFAAAECALCPVPDPRLVATWLSERRCPDTKIISGFMSAKGSVRSSLFVVANFRQRGVRQRVIVGSSARGHSRRFSHIREMSGQRVTPDAPQAGAMIVPYGLTPGYSRRNAEVGEVLRFPGIKPG
jgi:hypothetical protein